MQGAPSMSVSDSQGPALLAAGGQMCRVWCSKAEVKCTLTAALPWPGTAKYGPARQAFLKALPLQKPQQTHFCSPRGPQPWVLPG